MAEQPTGDYIPPEGSRVAINFRDKPASLNFKYVYYHAPAGDSVGLNFKGAYTPPAGDAVKLNFSNEDEEVGPRPEQYLFPAGFDAAWYGQPAVWNFHTKVSAAGFDSMAFGQPGIKNQMHPVRPSGWDAQAFGQTDAYLVLRPLYTAGFNAFSAGAARIFNRDQYVFAGNIAAPVLNQKPWVSLYTRELAAEGYDASRVGAHRVSHEVQRIETKGTEQALFGLPWVSYRVRVLAPEGAYREGMGSPQVGLSRKIEPEGFDASRFGERIIPEIQQVYPQGMREVWGTAGVKNWQTKVFAEGFQTTVQEEFRFGRAHAWNLTQIVQPLHDPLDGLNPPGFGKWVAVENRNRVLGAVGIVPARVGGPQIENKARALLVQGWDAAEDGKHLVAAGVRSYHLDGIEPPLLSRWLTVRNVADQLKAAGRDQAEFGQASLSNNRRTFQRIGNFDSSEFGQAFIADRVRGISVEPRYAIAPPDVPLPDVQLYTRYVDAPGAEFLRMGVPALSMHRNVIKPPSIYRDMPGNPEVRKLTPEVFGTGFNAEEFGDVGLRLQWRGLEQRGTEMALFGKPGIADTRRTLGVAGFNTLRIGDKLTVKTTGLPPLTTQKIEVERPASYGAAFGWPGLNQNVLSPQGIPIPKFGEAAVALMGARVDAGIRQDAYGVPRVELKVRSLGVGKWPEDEVFEPSAPRLSPHTIYAVKEAPYQAIRNHPGANLHYVGEDGEYPPGERFGKPGIAHRHRWINARGFVASDVGTASLVLGQQFVYPRGALVFRMGWHDVGDGTREVKQFGGASFMEIGKSAVGHVEGSGPRFIRPVGMESPAIAGTHWAALRVRSVAPSGVDTLSMGNSRGEASPFQWQSLHVGPYIPNIMPGWDSAEFGEAWISNRVREVAAAGFDAFVCTYDPKWFKERLRVTNATSSKPPVQSMSPIGFDAFENRLPNVKYQTQFIRPDGNGAQVRTGAAEL